MKTTPTSSNLINDPALAAILTTPAQPGDAAQSAPTAPRCGTHVFTTEENEALDRMEADATQSATTGTPTPGDLTVAPNGMDIIIGTLHVATAIGDRFGDNRFIPTLEKAAAIAAHLRALLALAEKRTPGRWNDDRKEHDQPYLPIKIAGNHHDICSVFIDDAPVEDYNREQKANAAFIAACAGSAEAGWRATLAAIEGLMQLEGRYLSQCHIDEIVKPICAAWPLSLLESHHIQ